MTVGMIPRRAAAEVRVALSRQAAVALLGPRQVGKTTLALEFAREGRALYLDLQSREDREKLRHPRIYLRRYRDRLVILDEVHRTPGLFADLRGLIDEGRRRGLRTGRFLILGSASVDLLKQAGESLAGRIEFVSLRPLGVLEASADDGATDALWLRGGFPDALLAASDTDSLVFRRNFIRTYLERDLGEFIQPRVPSDTLLRLWTMLAHAQGGLLSSASLARSLSISAPTVARYIDTLCGLLLVRRLPPFAANLKKRLVKSPKVYIRDSGVVHALLGIGDLEVLSGHPVFGASWEGFVIENLLAAAPAMTRASFYRTAAGAEMDLVLELPGSGGLWGVEVKRSTATGLGRGFHRAMGDLGLERAFVVVADRGRYPVAERTEVIGVREMAALLAGLAG